MEASGIILNEEIQVTRVFSAFEYTLPSDFSFPGEKHNGWEFVFVNSGKAIIKADDMTYVLKSGEMVCHKPMEFHSINPYQGEATVTIFCFSCDSDRMGYFNNKIILISQRQKQYIFDISESAAKVFVAKDPLAIARDRGMEKREDADRTSEQIVKNTIELLILSLMTAESTDRKRRSEFYEISTKRQTLSEDIRRYLHEHIAESVKLEDISQHFSYSLSSIKRIFKEETGYSVIDYLNELRIERAKSLLRESTDSIETISQSLGFSNVYYFTSIFRKKTGQTPGVFRRGKHKK